MNMKQTSEMLSTRIETYLTHYKKDVLAFFYTHITVTERPVRAGTYLELIQQFFNNLVCGHPAGDAYFSWSTKAWGEDRGL